MSTPATRRIKAVVHVGVGLLTFSPIVYLIPHHGEVPPAVVTCAGAVDVSTLPDVDLRIPLMRHRGLTHTVWFALGVGCLTALGAAAVSSAMELSGSNAGLGFTVGFLGVSSHLLGDALTPSGVRPIAPLVGRRYSLNLVRASDPAANYAAAAVGLAATYGAVRLGLRLDDTSTLPFVAHIAG